MAIRRPVPFDILIRPTKNVDAGNVIVVFVCESSTAAQPEGVYSIIDKKATLLREWRTPYQEEGFQPGNDSKAYRVSTSAGEFITSTAPGGGDEAGGMWFAACVFAIDTELGEAASVDRAEAGVKKIMPAIYSINHTGESDLPAEMAPPGLLWLAETGNMYSDQELTWKMRNGEHRNDHSTSPPNTMVQCYPVGNPYSGPFGPDSMTWSGYKLYAYRLDQPGTGTVYGKQLSANEDGLHVIAPEWNVSITSPPFELGVPLQDPPPLIGTDV